MSRKIDDMFNLEPAIPKYVRESYVPDKEDVFDVNDETNPLYKDKAVYMCVPSTNMHEGVSQALWLTKAKMMGEGKVRYIQIVSKWLALIGFEGLAKLDVPGTLKLQEQVILYIYVMHSNKTGNKSHRPILRLWTIEVGIGVKKKKKNLICWNLDFFLPEYYVFYHLHVISDWFL